MLFSRAAKVESTGLIRAGRAARFQTPLRFGRRVTRTREPEGKKPTKGAAVLVLTQDAATIICSIVESENGEEGGLRIAAREIEGDEATLELSVAREPEAADEVVAQEGAQVFLEPVAAQALADKVLDAAVDEGGVRFTLTEQPNRPITSRNGRASS
jgi:iron-sulfur cluster assembly protein